jgi:uncharacterized repeat protein (TIGR01451 family)
VLDEISDTLPDGFAFLGMMPESDVADAPTGTTGTITWDGPLTVEAGGTLTLVYQVETALVGGDLFPTNSVEALMGGETVGPATAPVELEKISVFMPLVFKDFSLAHFTVSKEASLTEVGEGETLHYTVRVVNEGNLPGVLDTVEDTLPDGFTFLNMMTGSDVTDPPSGTTGTIVWEGPFDMAAGAELTLIYNVQAASVAGEYVNSATVTTLIGNPPQTPGTAPVFVSPSILFEDDFEGGVDHWTPYTNIRRMNEDQWFWDAGQGFAGSSGYTHWCYGGGVEPNDAAEDTLTMYLGEGSEQWTDYRYTVKFNMISGKQIGVWFRGAYQESENKGQWVTGYYFTVRVRRNNSTDEAKLFQLRTEEEPGDETWPPYWYHVTNPLLLEEVDLATAIERDEWHQITVEVEGPHIRCYVDDELAIDFVDDEGSIFLEGTVGLYGYGDPYNSINWGVLKYDDVLVEPLD